MRPTVRSSDSELLPVGLDAFTLLHERRHVIDLVEAEVGEAEVESVLEFLRKVKLPSLANGKLAHVDDGVRLDYDLEQSLDMVDRQTDGDVELGHFHKRLGFEDECQSGHGRHLHVRHIALESKERQKCF